MKAIFALCLLVLLLICTGCAEDSEPTRPIDFLPLTGITIESQYPQIANLTTNQFRAVGNFSGVFTREITDQVVWSVDDPDVLEIEPNTGFARALTPGTATVTATADEISRTFEFTVTDAIIIQLDVEPATISLPLGLTQAFTAMGRFDDETVQDLTLLVEKWTSSVETVATIDDAGVATALSVGFTEIAATFQNVTGEAELTVTDAVLVSITFVPGEDTILIPNETLQLAATGTYSDGTTQDLTTQVLWSSSNTASATVSQTGVVTAVASGEAIITAQRDGRTAQLTVSVATLLSITVAPADGVPASVAVNGILQLIATGNFSGGLTRDITSQASWTSLNPTLATVSNEEGQKGMVTGLSPGNATIRATRNNIVGDLPVTVQ
jgi:trimeric autotransporter adhesin